MTGPLYLVDTHALFWYEFNLPQLSPAARQIFDDAEQGRAHLALNDIVLGEFFYLLRKLGFESDFAPYLQTT